MENNLKIFVRYAIIGILCCAQWVSAADKKYAYADDVILGALLKTPHSTLPSEILNKVAAFAAPRHNS